jgi:hypothetical protein
MSQQGQQAYYRPYDSGEDTDGSDYDNESASDVSEIDEIEDIRIRREQDPRYAIIRTPGPNLQTSEKQLQYMQNTPGAEWDESTNIKSLEDHVYLLPPKTSKTSLVSIKSINRDKRLYPTPFNFQLKLPRVYKDVTKFQLVQLSFPNSSNGVQQNDLYASSIVNLLLSTNVLPSCISTCVSVINCTTSNTSFGMIEQGRIDISGTPFLTTISVPPSNYDNPQLAQELTFQGNNTPPLNIIPYSTFYDVFTNTRDISILFNEPGTAFQSKTNNIRYGAHTKENIMNTYYSQQHIDSLPIITDKIAYNAYYFPILKEVIATQKSLPFIKPTSTMSYNDIVNAVMGPFLGLNSDTYYEICSINQGILDEYRKHLTFEMNNINSYKWTFNEKDNRFTTIHDTLHPSIQRDISKKYTTTMGQELASQGLNAASFHTLKTNSANYSCIFKHLETNLSSVLYSYHFAPGYRYSGGDKHYTTQSTFDTVTDLHNDIHFTSMFNYTSTIGRLYDNYAGIRMSFTNFLDYHSTLSSYYMILRSTTNSISSIHGNVNRDYHSYVSTKYNNVLPAQMISTQAYTTNQATPVSFVTNQHLYIPGQPLGNASFTSLDTTPSNNPFNVSRYIIITSTITSTTVYTSTVGPILSTLVYKSSLSVTSSITTFTNVSSSATVSVISYSYFINNSYILSSLQKGLTFSTAINVSTLTPVPVLSTVNYINYVSTTNFQSTYVIFNPPIFDYNTTTTLTTNVNSAITVLSYISSINPPDVVSTFSYSTVLSSIVFGSTFSTISTVSSVISVTAPRPLASVPLTAYNTYINYLSTPVYSSTITVTSSITYTSTFSTIDTDPNNCLSTCCSHLTKLVNRWYAHLPINTLIGTLQYRLGLNALSPQSFNVFSTIAAVTSTGNNNYLMSINDEQGFNNMDIAMTENHSISNETTGQVKLMAGKILMGNVGDTSVSQTLIQNPSLFENTLGKLDKLSIKIYVDDDAITPAWLYLPFTMPISEWDATFQIDEEVGQASRTTGWGQRPSIPVPINPDNTPYLHVTHRNNPNNI